MKKQPKATDYTVTMSEGDGMARLVERLAEAYSKEKQTRVFRGGAVRLALLEAAERRGIQNNGKGR